MCVQRSNKFRKIFIFTSAGKPIYSNGIVSPDALCLYSSSLSAILSKLSFALSAENSEIGNNQNPSIIDYLKWMSSETHLFITIEKRGIILCCISPFASDPVSYLKGLLEYVYYQIITLITGSIHKILDSRPNFDVQQMLSNSDVKIIDQCINSAQISYDSIHSCYISSKSSRISKPLTLVNNDSFSPLEPKKLFIESQPLEYTDRKEINRIISNVRVEGLLAGILFESSKLVTWFGSKHVKNLPTTDFSLINNIITSFIKIKAINEEFWVPICLPCISTVSYIYCYIHFWSSPQNSNLSTCLILLSSNGDTSVFEKFSLHSNNCRLKLTEMKYDEKLRLNTITPTNINRLLLSEQCQLKTIYHLLYVSITKNSYISSEIHPNLYESESIFQMYFKLQEIAHSQMKKRNGSTMILETQTLKFILVTATEFHLFLTTPKKSTICENELNIVLRDLRNKNKYLFL
ncbi:putative vacuolar fusion protein MON1 [Cryptosporidium felis]|nr:putative vacuolar fusion protein MON1 [Cryptosporidium felis]